MGHRRAAARWRHDTHVDRVEISRIAHGLVLPGGKLLVDALARERAATPDQLLRILERDQ